MSLFRQGLNDLIGVPDCTNVYEAMKAEHTSRVRFQTLNYEIESSPADEWEFVAEPVPGKAYALAPHARTCVALDEVMLRRPPSSHQDPHCFGCICCLTREEVIALRLYTGPMYYHYNNVLRKLLLRYVRQQKSCDEAADDDAAGHDPTPDEGVEYSTTIHMISSGIVKLSEIMRRPPTRKLFRGLSGMNVPECFFKEDALGWKVSCDGVKSILRRRQKLSYIASKVSYIASEVSYMASKVS